MVRCHSATLVHSGNCDAKKLRVSFQKHKSIDYGYPLWTRFHGTQQKSQPLPLPRVILSFSTFTHHPGSLGSCRGRGLANWDSLMHPKIGNSHDFHQKKHGNFHVYNSSIYIILTPMPMMYDIFSKCCFCCMCVFWISKTTPAPGMGHWLVFTILFLPWACQRQLPRSWLAPFSRQDRSQGPRRLI